MELYTVSVQQTFQRIFTFMWLIVPLAAPSRSGFFPPNPQPCQDRPVTENTLYQGFRV